MITTTFGGATVAILNDAPDWGTFGATFEAVTQWDAGLSGREARRPLASSIRAKVRQSIVADGTAALALAAFLRTYTTGNVVLPMWPLATTWAQRANIQTTGGLKVAYRSDWSQWELYTTTEPTWPTASDNVAPVVWGMLDEPSLSWVTPSTARADLLLVEDGPIDYQLQPATVGFGAGPSLSGYATAPRLWPFALNWSADIPEAFRVRILDEQIGFGRSRMETVYETPARTSTFATYTQSQSELWQLLAFFYQHAGGSSFWCPVWRSAVVMASDLAAGSTSLATTSAAGISAGDYLAFITGNTVAATARASSIAGSTVTLSAAPGAFAASQTVVCPLVLSRLDKPRLSIGWESGDVATVDVSISELPPEYAPASDETLGTTLGALPTRAWVYDLVQTVGGVTTTTRLTSYEANLTVDANTYTARKIGHGVIRSSLFIDRDEVTLDSEVVANDPLLLLATGKSEAPVRLVITTVNVSGTTGSGSAVVFTGDIVSVQVRGSKLTARAVSAGSVFDRMFPRFRMQVGCNHALFSVGCGLAAANWRFTANISGTPAGGYPYTFNLTGLARTIGTIPSIGAGWFAGGWIEFGSGSNMIRRAIVNSTANVSGALSVTIARDPSTLPAAGASVALYPGCDGAFATCSAKFANQLNFGGHPYLPATNPSLVKISSNVGGGKK